MGSGSEKNVSDPQQCLWLTFELSTGSAVLATAAAVVAVVGVVVVGVPFRNRRPARVILGRTLDLCTLQILYSTVYIGRAQKIELSNCLGHQLRY
jgi:hypothetical protein